MATDNKSHSLDINWRTKVWNYPFNVLNARVEGGGNQ